MIQPSFMKIKQELVFRIDKKVTEVMIITGIRFKMKWKNQFDFEKQWRRLSLSQNSRKNHVTVESLIGLGQFLWVFLGVCSLHLYFTKPSDNFETLSDKIYRHDKPWYFRYSYLQVKGTKKLAESLLYKFYHTTCFTTFNYLWNEWKVGFFTTA